MPSAAAPRYTSRQDNAHVTEERELLYQWHPWFGRKVHVHQSVGRGRAEIFRCSLDGLASVRGLELSGWMFDPAVCLGVRVAAAPWASRSALAALQALLHDAAGMALPPSALPEPILDAGRGYAADRAFRQYDAIDPENRLVAAELEQRWNRTLARVGDVESRLPAHDLQVRRRPDMSAVSFANLAADLPEIWRAPTTDARLKKRIFRTVIEEVVAVIDAEAGKLSLFLHWVGGAHTELRLPRRRSLGCVRGGKFGHFVISSQLTPEPAFVGAGVYPYYRILGLATQLAWLHPCRVSPESFRHPAIAKHNNFSWGKL